MRNPNNASSASTPGAVSDHALSPGNEMHTAFSREINLIKDKSELFSLLQNYINCTDDTVDLRIVLPGEDLQNIIPFAPDNTLNYKLAVDDAMLLYGETGLYDGHYNTVVAAHTGLHFFLLDDLVTTDLFPYYEGLTRKGFQYIGIAPLLHAGRIGGFLVLHFIDIALKEQLENLVAVITEKTGPVLAGLRADAALAQQSSENDLLLSLSRDITSCRSKEDVENMVRTRLARYFQFNEITICINNDDNLTHCNYIHTISEETLNHPGFADGIARKYYVKDGIYDVIQQSDGPVVFNMQELMQRTDRPYYVEFFFANGVKELIGFPVRINNESFGATFVYVKQAHSFTKSELRLAQAVCDHISIAVSNIRTYEQIASQLTEINTFKARLEEENHYLHEQIKTTYSYDEIAGSSAVMKEVFELIERVAPSDSTVLLEGETGTGKELVARAIHNTSRRKDHLMVKVNCAALPASLVESELFGHERGSFTGAAERHIGKFELADNGTLFLDEIGELPMELQVKLLRAIQEKEIERIGGKTVIKTNVRIVAATNRNLQEEVAKGRFRSDLFYRLNVFPITLPPLRHRREDIPVLAYHFLQRLSQRTGRQIDAIAQEAIEQMIRYDWPGNVRELEHLMERSLLMARGNILKDIYLPGVDSRNTVGGTEEFTIKTLDEMTRDYILFILRKCNGRVQGPGGAAELLDMPPTTLHSKMKKLGIRKSGK
ncbi:sigma 54-interacting transcriptional regulator [Chitinophagaceae bacterium MMS25-I14]